MGYSLRILAHTSMLYFFMESALYKSKSVKGLREASRTSNSLQVPVA